MNITLSADARLVEKTRRYAAQRKTSLNGLIRQYMRVVTGDDDYLSNANEFARLAREHGGSSPQGFVFDREDAHKRR